MNRQEGERIRRWVNRLHDGARQFFGFPHRLVEHPPVEVRLRRTLDALGETVFPAGGAIPYSGKDVDVATYVLDFLRKIPRQEGELFTLVILLYEYVLPKVLGKGWRFSDMPESRRAEFLEALHATPFFPLRFLNISVRMFLSFAYMSDERVLKEMGFFKRYAYASDQREIEVRWWSLRDKATEVDTEIPVAAEPIDTPPPNSKAEITPVENEITSAEFTTPTPAPTSTHEQ